MSQPDEVAQMVERLRSHISKHGVRMTDNLFTDAAALLERLQRELTEANEQANEWHRRAQTDRYKAHEAEKERDALRSRLEAAEALILDPVTLFHSPACIDRRFSGQCDCGVHALQERRRDYFAQRPAAEEQGT